MSKKNTVQKKKNTAAKSQKTKPEPKTIKMQKKAGRPKGSGKYGCETKAMRVPTHLIPDVLQFVERKIKAAKKAA